MILGEIEFDVLIMLALRTLQHQTKSSHNILMIVVLDIQHFYWDT